MATKRYNAKTFTFIVNGEYVNFHCDTTETKNSFIHHVFVYGANKRGEHSRVIYLNRTWESFEYETVLKHSVSKFQKHLRAGLLQQIEFVAKHHGDACAKDLQAFMNAFNSLSPEKKAAVRKFTPEITNNTQARIATKAVQIFSAI